MTTCKIINNAPVLVTSVILTKALGKGAGSLFICQIHYWLEKGCGTIQNGKRWIHNTAKEWSNQIGVSEKQIRNLIKKFSKLGILVFEKLNKKNWDQTSYISLNYERLNELVGQEMFIPKKMEISSTSRKNKIPLLNTKNNIKEKYKSDETVCDTTSSSVVQSSDSQQVEKIEKNILNEEKKIKDPEKKIEHNADTLNQNQTKTTTIVQDMISMWNNRFCTLETKLDKTLSRNLVAAFKTKFNSDLNQWDHYLRRIESSSYLTSKDFSLSVFWALKYQIIDRIGKGDFGVKEIQRTVSQAELNDKLEKHLETLNESEMSKSVRRKIAKVIGLPAYLSWFTKVVFVINERGIQFKSQNLFVNDYITTHYGYLLSK